MRLITQLALLFYTVVILFLVSFAIGVFALHWISINELNLVIQVIYSDHQMRWITGLTAILVLLMNVFFNRVIAGKEFKERNIAFDNPAGQVTLALTAMEDLLRRVINRMPEVKEVRASRITAVKKGLAVQINLALCSEVNIPEFTAQLQEIIKRKINDTIGIEGTMTVRIDVTKIAIDDKKVPKNKGADDISQDLESSVPFQGYRA